MLRHTSANITLNKKDAYDNAPEIFKTKNVEMYGKYLLIKEKKKF